MLCEIVWIAICCAETALRAMLEAITVDRHHRCLRHREESRKDEQRSERDGESA